MVSYVRREDGSVVEVGTLGNWWGTGVEGVELVR